MNPPEIPSYHDRGVLTSIPVGAGGFGLTELHLVHDKPDPQLLQVAYEAMKSVPMNTDAQYVRGHEEDPWEYIDIEF